MLQIWSKMKFLSALYHMGVKYVKKVLGTGRDGQLTQINVKFWKNWPTLLGPGRFSRDFIPTSIILKGYFIPIKFGAAQTRCIFEVWGHCAAPDWACRKNPWSISYLWTKICWKQFWPGQLFWIDDPYCPIFHEILNWDTKKVGMPLTRKLTNLHFAREVIGLL